MQVNLSRIHNMIKQQTAEMRRLQIAASAPLLAGSRSFSFQVLEGTTDADIRQFTAKIKGKKDQLGEIFVKMRQTDAYCCYLRGELDRANRGNAVCDRLLRLGCLQRHILCLEKIREIMALSCSEDLEPVRGADYYKTAFSDNQKTYELSLRIFSEQDLADLDRELETARRGEEDLKDEIALINQTTMVEILSREEFMARREKR